MRTTVTLLCATLALSACEVSQTEEGDLPDVDVSVEPGNMPEYEVNWADVDIGTEERIVEIPKLVVVMEEESVTVPVIDVSMDGTDQVERTLTAAVDVPHSGYALNIESVVAEHGKERLLVVARLEEADPGAATGTNRISDRVVLRAPDVDVRYLVIGERPEGIDNLAFDFYPSWDALPMTVREGRVIYEGSTM